MIRGVDFAVMMLLMMAVVVVLAWRVQQSQRECARQQRRAEEAEMWLLHADDEIARMRNEYAMLEHWYWNLQQMYAELVRRRLVDSWPLIARQR